MKPLYLHTEEYHNYNAPKEVVPFLMDLLAPKSVLDIGCGIGTWLKIFEEYGVADYLGIDGDYVDRSMLKIPADKFISKDLRKPCLLDRKFDLVVSLEVAEHIPEEYADLFVETLVQHADTIVFSAAIPFQGGQNHLNEQWPTYWEEKFRKHNFFFHDLIRPKIWNNSKIEWWYKQNIILIKKDEQPPSRYLTMIHPDLYMLKHQYQTNLHEGNYGLIHTFQVLLRAIKTKFKRKGN